MELFRPRAFLCIFLALLLALGMGCPSEKEESEFVCFLIDSRANEAGIKGADLGVPVSRGDGTTWLLFGDVIGAEKGKGGASALAISSTPFNCDSFYWKKSGGAFYQPLRSERILGDESTVPSGAIELNGTLYIYAARIIEWGQNFDPGTTRGRGMLFREQNGTFISAAQWDEGSHINNAPALGKLPDGREAVFVAFTGKYRGSPIYLAYVLPEEIESPLKYMYFSGMESGNPEWAHSLSEAEPLGGMENMRAGELSLAYNPILKKYLLSFKDYSAANKPFYVYSAPEPWGPYSKEIDFTPCASGAGKAEWMEAGWGGCYGGYIIPGSFGSDGKDIYFTVSVWNPYTTIISKGRIE